MCQSCTDKQNDYSKLIVEIEDAAAIVENRAKHFKKFLADHKITFVYVCHSCGFPTLKSNDGYDICSLCDWEDDGSAPNEWTGGPNYITLNQSRYEFQTKLERFITRDKTLNWTIADYTTPFNSTGWDNMPFDIEKGMTQLLLRNRIPEEKYNDEFNVAFVKNGKLTSQEYLLVAEAKQCFWYPEAFSREPLMLEAA